MSYATIHAKNGLVGLEIAAPTEVSLRVRFAEALVTFIERADTTFGDTVEALRLYEQALVLQKRVGVVAFNLKPRLFGFIENPNAVAAAAAS